MLTVSRFLFWRRKEAHMDEIIFPPGEKGEHPAEKGLYSMESVLFSVEYAQTLTLVKQAINSCAECQCKVSGIDKNEAKIGAYWAAATYRQDEKKVSPVLLYVGETSTGKSQNEKKVRDYCCNPSEIINAKIQSYATVRDKIIKWTKGEIEGKEEEKATTIIIEESDRNKYAEDLEEFIYNSYDRTTSQGAVNRERTGKDQRGYEPELYDIWAAFMEHRRNDPDDAANARRGIAIETHRIIVPEGEEDFPMADEIPSPNADKMHLVADLVLMPADRPKGIEGGVWNNWEMLIQIASALQDFEWVSWARERMKQDSELLQDGRGFEPQVVAFNSLVTNLEKTLDGKIKSVKLSEIVETARREHGINMKHKTVSKLLKRLKIPYGSSNGVLVFKPTHEVLERVAKRLGLDTDLGEIKTEDESRTKGNRRE